MLVRLPFILTLEIADLMVVVSILRDQTVLIAFSEPVSGFQESDIRLTGGSLSGFVGNGQQYCVDVARSVADTAAVLHIPAGVATAVGNRLNLRSNDLAV